MMAVGRAPVCLWCVAAHAVNVLLVLAIHRLYRHSGRSRLANSADARVSPETRPPNAESVVRSRLAACACVFALVLTAGLWFHRHEQLAMADRLRAMRPYKDWVTSHRQDPAFLLREHDAQPENAIPLRPGESTGDGRPRLVVFTDYECAACACNAAKLREQVMPAFDGQLHVAIRHFPLCNGCNPAAGGVDHPNACAAACAVEAARRQGGETAAHRMHDLLFENRRRLGTALYQDLAARIGLDARRFVNDLHDDDVREVIRQDVALAQRLGVDATPAMFLDGRRVTAFDRNNPVFWAAIARERGATRGGARVAARP
jgi:predicted DsbA family dithiol-disulfide isomerase